MVGMLGSAPINANSLAPKGNWANRVPASAILPGVPAAGRYLSRYFDVDLLQHGPWRVLPEYSAAPWLCGPRLPRRTGPILSKRPRPSILTWVPSWITLSGWRGRMANPGDTPTVRWGNDAKGSGVEFRGWRAGALQWRRVQATCARLQIVSHLVKAVGRRLIPDPCADRLLDRQAAPLSTQLNQHRAGQCEN